MHQWEVYLCNVFLRTCDLLPSIIKTSYCPFILAPRLSSSSSCLTPIHLLSRQRNSARGPSLLTYQATTARSPFSVETEFPGIGPSLPLHTYAGKTTAGTLRAWRNAENAVSRVRRSPMSFLLYGDLVAVYLAVVRDLHRELAFF